MIGLIILGGKQMKIKKSLLNKPLCLALAVLMSVAVAGCGTKTQSGSTQQAKINAAKTGFKWNMAKGATIKVMFDQHTYSDAVIKELPAFEQKTGIHVQYSVTPEENYFDKVTTALSSRSGDPDVFMTGAYEVWEYASADEMQPLDEFLNDKNLTSPDFDFNDFYPNITGALKWDLKPGDKVGSGSQWALPMGFEMYELAYNKRIFKEKNLTPPKTMDELVADAKALENFNGPGTYGLALRGTRNWATIHPGYMTEFTNYGATDFSVENGKLVSQVNSKAAVDMTDTWVKLIKEGGSPTWSTYTWYQAGADLGAGKAAMMLDADCVEYFENPAGASKEAGNLAWVPAPLPTGQTTENSNLWTWSLAMNKYSHNQEAAWLFMQYFTSKDYQLWSATDAKCMDPVRKSVFNNSDLQKTMALADGYEKSFEQTVGGAKIEFTPQPNFFETTTDWAATLQDLVGGKYKSTQAGMDALKTEIDKVVSNVSVK